MKPLINVYPYASNILRYGYMGSAIAQRGSSGTKPTECATQSVVHFRKESMVNAYALRAIIKGIMAHV